MPKMKTKKAAAKRFSLTGTGKIKYKKKGLMHILKNKSASYNRDKRKTGYVHASDKNGVLSMLPYAKRS